MTSSIARITWFLPVTGNVSTTKFALSNVHSPTSMMVKAFAVTSSETERTVSLGPGLSKGQVAGPNTMCWWQTTSFLHLHLQSQPSTLLTTVLTADAKAAPSRRDGEKSPPIQCCQTKGLQFQLGNPKDSLLLQWVVSGIGLDLESHSHSREKVQFFETRMRIIFNALTWRDQIEIIIWPYSYFETRTRLQIVSSVRSSYSHPDLLLTRPPHPAPLFQITPVLNTGL